MNQIVFLFWVHYLVERPYSCVHCPTRWIAVDPLRVQRGFVIPKVPSNPQLTLDLSIPYVVIFYIYQKKYLKINWVKIFRVEIISHILENRVVFFKRFAFQLWPHYTTRLLDRHLFFRRWQSDIGFPISLLQSHIKLTSIAMANF